MYRKLLESISKDSKIINISIGDGQLDLLLLLDGADRRICTFIEDETIRTTIKNSFITNHYNRIKFAATKEEALAFPADVVILNKSDEELIRGQNNENNNIFGGEVVFEAAKLVIFKQKISS